MSAYCMATASIFAPASIWVKRWPARPARPSHRASASATPGTRSSTPSRAGRSPSSPRCMVRWSAAGWSLPPPRTFASPTSQRFSACPKACPARSPPPAPPPENRSMTTTETSTPTDAERELAAAHVEFARREAAKIPDISADLPVRPIRRVAVIGAGTMGGGIAMSLANIGIASTLIDADPAALDRGLGRVRANYASSVSRGRLAQSAMDERVGAIRGSVNIADVKDADLVIEAVFEDLALKQSIFRQLDPVAKPCATLATNTSGPDA